MLNIYICVSVHAHVFPSQTLLRIWTYAEGCLMVLHIWVLSDPTIAGCSVNNPLLTDSFHWILSLLRQLLFYFSVKTYSGSSNLSLHLKVLQLLLII